MHRPSPPADPERNGTRRARRAGLGSRSERIAKQNAERVAEEARIRAFMTPENIATGKLKYVKTHAFSLSLSLPGISEQASHLRTRHKGRQEKLKKRPRKPFTDRCKILYCMIEEPQSSVRTPLHRSSCAQCSTHCPSFLHPSVRPTPCFRLVSACVRPCILFRACVPVACMRVHSVRVCIPCVPACVRVFVRADSSI